MGDLIKKNINELKIGDLVLIHPNALHFDLVLGIENYSTNSNYCQVHTIYKGKPNEFPMRIDCTNYVWVLNVIDVIL